MFRITLFHCNRCDHSFVPRKVNRVRCPRCSNTHDFTIREDVPNEINTNVQGQSENQNQIQTSYQDETVYPDQLQNDLDLSEDKSQPIQPSQEHHNEQEKKFRFKRFED